MDCSGATVGCNLKVWLARRQTRGKSRSAEVRLESRLQSPRLAGRQRSNRAAGAWEIAASRVVRPPRVLQEHPVHQLNRI